MTATLALLDCHRNWVNIPADEAYLRVVGMPDFKFGAMDRSAMLAFRKWYLIKGGRLPITASSIDALFSAL